MLDRLLPDPSAAFYRRDLPEPIHVPNLLTFDDRASYRRYARAVVPLIKLLGGGPKWLGEHREAYVGDRQAEEFLLVEYPSHRRLLLMTHSPVYPKLDEWRRAGVEYFEGAFTYSPEHDADLWRHDHLLVVHFSPARDPTDLSRVQSAFADTDAEFVYSTRSRADFSEYMGEPRRGSDPHPLTYPQLACFAVPDPETADDLAPTVTDDLADATADFALQRYERADGV